MNRSLSRQADAAENFDEDAEARRRPRNLKPIGKPVVQLPPETAGMAIVDTQLRYVQIDEALARLNGLSVEAHLGKTVHEVLPQLAPLVEPIIRHTIETGEPTLNIQLEREVATHPGERRRRLVSFIPIQDNEGRICGVGTLAVDLVDQHEQRARPARTEGWFERARGLVEAHPPVPLSNRLQLIRDVAAALEFAAQAIEQGATRARRPDIKDGIDFYEEVSRFETELIAAALHETGGNQTRAARLLGLKLTTLHDKIKRYKIKWPPVHPAPPAR